jgi:hypothetical protein
VYILNFSFYCRRIHEHKVTRYWERGNNLVPVFLKPIFSSLMCTTFLFLDPGTWLPGLLGTTPPPPLRERSTLPWHVDPHNYVQILALESRGNKTHRSGTVPHFSIRLITHIKVRRSSWIQSHNTTFIGCLYSPTCCLPDTQCYLLGSMPKSKKLPHFEALLISKGSVKDCIPYYRILSNLRPTPNVSRHRQFSTRNGRR